jgi:flavin-binding protein dodecin
MIRKEDRKMADSVSKVIELVGASTESGEKAATSAVETDAKPLRRLRGPQIVELDMHLEEGKALAYRCGMCYTRQPALHVSLSRSESLTP